MSGLVFIYGYNAMSAVLRGMGDSVRPFIFIAVAAVGNIVMDILFVLMMGMGSAGAALATVLSQAFSFIGCAVYIFRNKEKYELTLARSELLCIDRSMLANLVKLGIPMAIKTASIHLSKLFVNSYVNSYGVAVSAFAGIANKMSGVVNTLSNAFNTSGASMVGQNIGAGNYDRVGKVMKSVYAITTTLAAAFSLLICIFPKQIYGLFTNEPDVIAIGIKFVPIACVLFFGSAARSGMNALINGSGNYKVNFATAILDGIVLRIGFALLFGLALGMKHYGFWLGDALAGFTPLWIGLVFYYSGSWKKQSV
jgi:putative MATE family efflux protein